MAGHMGDDRVTTQNLEVVSTDVERGLILVQGAVPGSKGAWILVRDAVKIALPANAPKPAAIRAAAADASRSSGRTREPNNGSSRSPPSTARTPARSTLSDDDLRPRAARRHPAPHGALAARQEAAGHAQGQGPRRSRPHRPRCTSRRAPAAPVTASARAPQFRGGGKAHGPVVAQPRARPAQEGPRARPASMRCRPRPRLEHLIVIDSLMLTDAKTKALRGAASASSA